MQQSISFSDAIDREAIKARANAHIQNSLPDKDTTLKTTQTFHKNSFELHLALWSLLEKVEKSVVWKISKFASAPSLSVYTARPAKLINFVWSASYLSQRIIKYCVDWRYNKIVM